MKTIAFDKNRYHDHLDMQRWCVDQFGYGTTWCFHHDSYGSFRFEFEEEIQYNWFMLRWA